MGLRGAKVGSEGGGSLLLELVGGGGFVLRVDEVELAGRGDVEFGVA